MRTIIVGAGMAGLSAAKTLQSAGQDYLLLEKSDRVGGRVKSDQYQGFTLDHGFQVLLTAYPAAKEFFNYEELDLKNFDAGAVIQQPKQKPLILDDPSRKPLRLFSMAIETRIGLLDKLRTLKLKRKINKTDIENFFTKETMSSNSFLKKFGFSSKFIDLFFEPFYAGISLRSNLEVDAAFFQFVFKMFSNGEAAVPKKGMGELANHLAKSIPPEKIRFNSHVLNASATKVSLDNGEELNCNRCIMAVPSKSPIWRPYNIKEQVFISTYVFYFSANTSIYEDKKLHLFPGKDTMANNLANLTAISSSYSPEGKNLISVQVNAQSSEFPSELNRPAEVLRVELQQFYPDAKNWIFLKAYKIENALPLYSRSQWPIANDLIISENLYAAGDSFGFASLQSALHSGKLAAQLACR